MSNRILVAGGPRCGKTTIAKELAAGRGVVAVRSTDDTIGLDWSAASEEVARWFGLPGPWVIEGVAVPRALRKWLKANSDGVPADRIHWLFEPHAELSRGQQSMMKATETVWDEILPELLRRGVPIHW